MSHAGTILSANQVEASDNDQRQKQADALKLQTAPLVQSLTADRQKLTAFIDPNTGNPLPDHEKDYAATVNSMADTIGRLRSLTGQRSPDDEPNHLESTGATLLDRLHITRDLMSRLQNRQAGKVTEYQNKNHQIAGDVAAGTLPYAMTSEGQAEAQKTTDAVTVANARAKNVPEYKNVRGPNGETATIDVKTTAVPAGWTLAGNTTAPKTSKGLKALEQGGVAFGVQDQDTGKQYLPSQLAPDGDAPPEAKQIWKTIQDVQQKKADEQAKRDQERDKRLASTLGNLGTWGIAEDGNGNTTLYNSKTGQTKDAPTGLHKSGYYTKQVAPLEAAKLNIDDYLNGGVFTGAGDLALQHEFFTATQPATGFRMTKVQQDSLLNSASVWERMKARVQHADAGIMFSDKQRKEIADAARKAIATKKAALSGTAGGPKTDKLRQTQQGGAPSDPFAQFGGKKH